MNNKYLYLIPLVLLEAILQLAFFWLAPAVPCYWIVYAFGSALTLIHIGVTFVLGIKYGVRRSAATVVAGSVCQVILITVCAVLLAGGSEIRNAIFALLIVSMLYAVIVTLLVLSIEKNDMLDLHTVNPFDDGSETYPERRHNDIMVDYPVENPIPKPHRPMSTVGTMSINQTTSRASMAVNANVTPPPLPMRR